MAKENKGISWVSILVGALMIAGALYKQADNSKITDTPFNSKTVTLYRDAKYMSGSRSTTSHFSLWTNEFNAMFKIYDAGGAAAAKSGLTLDGLKKGDTLTIQYHASREADLNDKAKEIPIYFLKKAGKVYFDPESYSIQDKAIDNRWHIILLIGGILIILNALKIFGSKSTYILGAIGVAAIIILKVLDKF